MDKIVEGFNRQVGGTDPPTGTEVTGPPPGRRRRRGDLPQPRPAACAPRHAPTTASATSRCRCCRRSRPTSRRTTRRRSTAAASPPPARSAGRRTSGSGRRTIPDLRRDQLHRRHHHPDVVPVVRLLHRQGARSPAPTTTTRPAVDWARWRLRRAAGRPASRAARLHRSSDERPQSCRRRWGCRSPGRTCRTSRAAGRAGRDLNGKDADAYARLLAPDRRFHLVGDQVSTLPGWQEGAMMSAEHVVEQIGGRRPRTVPEIRRAPNTRRLVMGLS